jgi:hypothetical protein
VHTLYGIGDLDYAVFTAGDGGRYIIKTENLLNGADTKLTLFNSDGTTPTPGTSPGNPNDNANGATYTGFMVPSDLFGCDYHEICHENGNDILGSSLTFTASVPGNYYVKIESSPTRPISAGRYGTYTLKITSQ